MKKTLLIVMATLAMLASTADAYARTYVHGYTKRNGTYVSPHTRSSPSHHRSHR